MLKLVLTLAGGGTKILGVILNRFVTPKQEISWESHLYQLKVFPPEESA